MKLNKRNIMSRMLYRFSEEEKSRKDKEHGLNVDKIVVEEEEVEEMAKEGWCKTPALAVELYESFKAGDISLDGNDDTGFDADGYPWDERINLKDKSKTQKGIWKIKPGTKQEVLDSVRAEIKPPEADTNGPGNEDLTEPTE